MQNSLVNAAQRARDGQVILELDRHWLAGERLEDAEDELEREAGRLVSTVQRSAPSL